MLTVTATAACAAAFADPTADTPPPTSLAPLDSSVLLGSSPATTPPTATNTAAPSGSAPATVPATTVPATTSPPSGGLGDSIGVSDSVTIRVLED